MSSNTATGSSIEAAFEAVGATRGERRVRRHKVDLTEQNEKHVDDLD